MLQSRGPTWTVSASGRRQHAAGRLARPSAVERRQQTRGSGARRTPVGAAPDQLLPDGLLSFDPDSQDSMGVATAPPGARPIVILPGFGNNTSDYTAPFGLPQLGLATQLRERGWRVSVVDLERKAWLNVARSLLTLGVWRGTLTTHPGYTWYLERVAAAVREAQDAAGADSVHLLGHSAGGWLGRAFIGGAPGSGIDTAGAGSPVASADGRDTGAPAAPHPAVASLTTLGTPHRPPPPGSGARDMTGGALGWVDRAWPGAAFGDSHGVRYVAVAGRAVQGCAQAAKAKQRCIRGYAYASYSQVLGSGDSVWGDSVVPTEQATLDGAANVVLDGVRHSMARVGTWDERAGEEHIWYGDERVLDSWAYHIASFDSGDGASDTSPGAGADGGVVLPAGAGRRAAGGLAAGGA